MGLSRSSPPPDFSPAFLAVQNTATLVNISTRLNILTGDNVLDGGFIVVGSGFKDVLIRGLGPSLASAGHYRHAGRPDHRTAQRPT